MVTDAKKTNHFTFSRAKLLALPPAQKGKRDYYYDEAEPGLTLMVTPAGSKIFQLYMKHQGRPVRVRLGDFSPGIAESAEVPRDCTHTKFLINNPNLNVRMARSLAALVKLDIKSGTNPTEAKKEKRGELSLGEMFEEYAAGYLVKKQRKGIEGIRGDFERLLGAIPKTEKKKHGSIRQKTPGSVNWSNRRLSTITRGEIQQLMSNLAKQSSKFNANKALILIRSILNRACEDGFLKQINPAEGIEAFVTKSRERFLQDDEMPRYFDSLAMEPSKDMRDYFAVALLTGARKSNVLEMRWEDINFAQETWRVKGEFTKNGDPLILPLSAMVIEILNGRKPKGPAVHVFPGRGTSGHMADPRRGWERLLDRDEYIQLSKRIGEAGRNLDIDFQNPYASNYKPLATALKEARKMAKDLEVSAEGARLKDLRPHDLRRTLGSWQAIAGASLLVIKQSLGHKSDAAGAIYARLKLDPVRGSVNSATQAMLAAAGINQGATVTPIKMAKKGKK